MLHMQHHILCNISYVVIAESMERVLSIQQGFNILHSTHYIWLYMCRKAGIDAMTVTVTIITSVGTN